MNDEGRVWVPDRSWRVPSMFTKCRASTRNRCPNAPVADLNRGAWTRTGRADRWWAYCGEHLYGRRIENGKVLIGVHPESPAAKRGEIS